MIKHDQFLFFFSNMTLLDALLLCSYTGASYNY